MSRKFHNHLPTIGESTVSTQIQKLVLTPYVHKISQSQAAQSTGTASWRGDTEKEAPTRLSRELFAALAVDDSKCSKQLPRCLPKCIALKRPGVPDVHRFFEFLQILSKLSLVLIPWRKRLVLVLSGTETLPMIPYTGLRINWPGCFSSNVYSMNVKMTSIWSWRRCCLWSFSEYDQEKAKPHPADQPWGRGIVKSHDHVRMCTLKAIEAWTTHEGHY